MDLKKFSMFIILFGLLILCVGGGMYITNRPVTAKSGIIGKLKALDKNRYREKGREKAMKVMIGGAIVSFVGAGAMVSIKKK